MTMSIGDNMQSVMTIPIADNKQPMMTMSVQYNNTVLVLKKKIHLSAFDK